MRENSPYVVAILMTLEGEYYKELGIESTTPAGRNPHDIGRRILHTYKNSTLYMRRGRNPHDIGRRILREIFTVVCRHSKSQSS